MKVENKVMLTTFALFMTEAVIHYNFGKRDCKKKNTKGIIPPTSSLIRLAVVVGVFSFLNGQIIKQIR